TVEAVRNRERIHIQECRYGVGTALAPIQADRFMPCALTVDSNNNPPIPRNKLSIRSWFPKLSSTSTKQTKFGAESSHLEPVAPPPASDLVRINLPEILDCQDEITILRLLIKLLSAKVQKLTNENQQLLEHIST